LGVRPDERLCVVTVGGSGVGKSLIHRILAAVPLARAYHPELRVIVVTGPRLPPSAFPAQAGVEYRGFEPRLPELLAVCDLALVQGGLSTTMELAATGAPFIYFPLAHHFEQSIHVAHRLDRYRAGRRLEWAEANPDAIAAAMREQLHAPLAPCLVERDGASRAARMISEMIS
jgi:predicted glycosyltransferase